jgi:hypothetical protein
MIRFHDSYRPGLRVVARSGMLTSAVMLVISIASAIPADAALPAGAGPTPGQSMQANNNTSGITNGVQDTPFVLSYAGDSACAGDSATDGYRVNTFMVPASVDVSQLTYNSGGPTAPAGVTFKFPLFAQTGNAQQVNRNTAPTTGIITAGNLLQPFSFAALVAGGIEVPNGSYKVGLACTLLGVTEEYWETTIAVTASTTGPVTFAWQVTDTPTTTTTTSTTTSSTTTTTIAVTTTTRPTTTTTTTTLPGATTTTTTTTTTPASASSSTALGSLIPTPSGGVGSSGPTAGNIPVTGSSSIPIVVWAMLLLVFGRMTILFARPVRVLPPVRR